VLYENQLTLLSPEIGNLAKLQELHLNNNQLATLPPEMGKLTNLRTLDLSENQLSALPAEIGQLKNLSVLSLFNNKLPALPLEIGQLTNLQYLNLNQNRLSVLPSEIGNTKSLQQLFLTGNKIKELPPSLLQRTDMYIEVGCISQKEIPQHIYSNCDFSQQLPALTIEESQEPSAPWKWEPLTSGKKIPKNAIPGGQSASKVNTFICRTTYDKDIYGGLHTGVFENDSCRIGWGGLEIVRDTFDILILKTPTETKWVKPADIQEYSEESPWRVVRGGWNEKEQSTPLYVARALLGEAFIPGKNLGENCNFSYRGKEEVSRDFELLLVRVKK
jgi:hypothetical protein